MIDEIQWTKEPPKEAGLYPYTVESNGETYVMQVTITGTGTRGRLISFGYENALASCPISAFKGHWGPRIDFAPYVPPKPPEIEAWVCERNGLQHRAIKYGLDAIMLTQLLTGLASEPHTCRYEAEKAGFTNWRKLKVTTEWET